MAKNYLGQERSDADLRKLPEELADKIDKKAANPKYQHVTGCKCKRDCPGEGVANRYKIAKELGIGHPTVHIYLDQEFKEHADKLKKDHAQSENGRAKKREYRISTEGKETMNRFKRHRKNRNKKYCTRYRKSDKGKESAAKGHFIAAFSLLPYHLTLKNLSESKRAYINYFNEAFDTQIKLEDMLS